MRDTKDARGRSSSMREDDGFSSRRGASSGARDDRHSSRGRTSSSRAPQPAGRGGVPVPVVILLLVVCVVVSVVLTRCAMAPQLTQAKADATAAEEQVTALNRQLEQKTKELELATKSTDGANANDSSTNTSTSNGVESPWTTNGRYTSGDATLDGYVKAFVDSKVDSSMGKDAAALEMYKGIAWSDYVERDSAQHPSGKDWRLVYAKQYYENGCSGNCYEFAAFLMYCMQYMGFDDAKAEGVLVELQSGGWGDHGIVYVTNTDGSSCMCDTARGTDGWMLPVGAYNVQIEDLENA